MISLLKIISEIRVISAVRGIKPEDIYNIWVDLTKSSEWRKFMEPNSDLAKILSKYTKKDIYSTSIKDIINSLSSTELKFLYHDLVNLKKEYNINE